MRVLTLIVFIVAVVKYSRSEDALLTNDEDDTVSEIPESPTQLVNMTELIHKAIEEIEKAEALAENFKTQNVFPKDEYEMLYSEMMDTITYLSGIIETKEHAQTFLKANGIKRVVIPNLKVEYSKLKMILLNTLKILFKADHSTTSEFIPITAMDNLIDIFENDDNLALKSHVIDILDLWLPGNPKAQVRVMKLKGLDPFYEQFDKLDTNTISTLLNLFNKLLVEHFNVRYDKKVRSETDSNELLMYQRIGLVERMSSATVCGGLINMFASTWSYSNHDSAVLAPVFDLVKHMKPYCLKVLKGQPKAIELFEALSKYVKDENRKEYFANLNLNITDIKLVLEDYVDELQIPQVKDEF